MKTLLSFFLPFLGLTTGSFLSNHHIPDAALIFASAFTASLTLWTFRQYDRQFAPLLLSKPLHLPMPGSRKKPLAPPRRLAA